MFEIEIREQGNILLRGRLDASEAEKAIGVLRGLPGPIIADCSELEYISSAGLGNARNTRQSTSWSRICWSAFRESPL